MVMYGIYNSDTLEKLINTVQKMHKKQLGIKICLWVSSISGINGLYQITELHIML